MTTSSVFKRLIIIAVVPLCVYRGGVSHSQTIGETATTILVAPLEYVIKPNNKLFGIMDYPFGEFRIYDMTTMNVVHSYLFDYYEHSVSPYSAAISNDGRKVYWAEDGNRIFCEDMYNKVICDTIFLPSNYWMQRDIRCVGDNGFYTICSDWKSGEQAIFRIDDGIITDTIFLPNVGYWGFDANENEIVAHDDFNNILIIHRKYNGEMVVVSRRSYINEPDITKATLLSNRRIAVQFSRTRTVVYDSNNGKELFSIKASAHSYDPDADELYFVCEKNLLIYDPNYILKKTINITSSNVIDIYVSKGYYVLIRSDARLCSPLAPDRNIDIGPLRDVAENDSVSLFKGENVLAIQTKKNTEYHYLANTSSIAVGRSVYAFTSQDTVYHCTVGNSARTLICANEKIDAVCFSKDDDLYALTNNGNIYVIESGRNDLKWHGKCAPDEKVYKISVSYDEKYMLVYCERCIMMINLSNYEQKQLSQGTMRFLGRGSIRCSYSEGSGDVHILDIETYKTLFRFNTTDKVSRSAISGDNEFLLVATRDRRLICYNINTGAEMHQSYFPYYILRMYDCGKYVYIYTKDRVLYRYSWNAVLSVENIGEKSISAYPNPSRGEISLSGMERGDLVYVYDDIGRCVSITNADQNVMKINGYGVRYLVIKDRNGVQRKTIKMLNK